MMSSKAFLIGIAGGTGSGKTSLAKSIVSHFNPSEIDIIQQDSYYKDLINLPIEEREKTNFDHPNAIDFNLMKNQLNDLIYGKSIEVPIYDFSTHTRIKKTRHLNKINIIIFEGILSLHDPEIRKLMNMKIFVETADDIRVMRRIKRDVNKRNRSLLSVIKQYNETVRPMHLEYVEKTKKHADIIIPEGSHNEIAIDIIKTKIISIIEKNTSKQES